MAFVIAASIAASFSALNVCAGTTFSAVGFSPAAFPLSAVTPAVAVAGLPPACLLWQPAITTSATTKAIDAKTRREKQKGRGTLETECVCLTENSI